jgi:hypothetical protein
MNARLILITFVLLAFSAGVHAQGRGGTVHKGTKQEIKQAQSTYVQCVYNQAGYVAKVQWFAQGTMKAGANNTISPTRAAFQTENISLGQKSCVSDTKSTRHVAMLSVQGGKYARAFAIAAIDIAAIGSTIGCGIGAAALTVITAGAGAVTAAACEVYGDAAIGVVADPSIIPDAKTVFAVVQPPSVTGTSNPQMIFMYGTVFSPATKVARVK